MEIDKMTIAISIKVNDGVVLAADSASTLFGAGGVQNVYNTANKVFNLYKGLPIGSITWGSGGIGNSSISTLIKDLRKRFMGFDKTHQDWKIDKESYKMEDVAKAVKTFFYDEQYKKFYTDPKVQPVLGFIIAGYSTNEELAEEWRIFISNGNCEGPTLLRPKEISGIAWDGQPELLYRIIKGHGTGLQVVLENLGTPKNQIPTVIQNIESQLEVPLHHPAMPIQDAIDLANFLVEATIMFSRFAPGAPTVGGPIEIAAITKHEDFKWVDRKLYYSDKLNPTLYETNI